MPVWNSDSIKKNPALFSFRREVVLIYPGVYSLLIAVRKNSSRVTLFTLNPW